jgi:tetratricopeptide (TPR) repeat protein
MRVLPEAAWGVLAWALLGCSAGGPRVVATPAFAPGAPAEPRPAFLLDERAAEGLRARAEELYLKGELQKARDAFRTLAGLGGRASSGGPAAAWSSYWLGRAEYALGRMGEARRALEAALAGSASVSRPKDLRAYALVSLADVAAAQSRPAEALGLLDRLESERLSGRLPPDEVLFRRATVLALLGRRASSREAFLRLAARWPESDLAPEAARRARPGFGGYYRVRIAAFETLGAAEALADAVLRAGVRARVEVERRSGGALFVVSLGEFGSREEADRTARGARSRGLPAEVSVRVAP